MVPNYGNSTKRGAVVCFPPTTMHGPVVGGKHTTAPLLVLAGMPLLLGLKNKNLQKHGSKQWQINCLGMTEAIL